MNKNIIRTRQRARKLALQALYQWMMSADNIVDIELQFITFNNMLKVDARYFHDLLCGVSQNLVTVEQEFAGYLDRPLTSLNPVELTLLRIGTYELLYNLDIPYRIILDEAISLNKEFGTKDGHRYVNGVLNQVARKIRYGEISS
ncbi:MAG: N utilization substance protein B [Legionellales bacterium RIFCSPHIGHO2_12_FULL_42_9]|nr:MAG: N utilization substance protein B [Legionellales bacterium RIFCSPHIGHO2_12_FULL_42_9]